MTHRSRAPQTTPSKETLDQTNLAQIGSLLWADAFTTPIIRLFDMSTFGKQLVNSGLTVAMVLGISVSDVSQNAMANLSWKEISLTHPCFVGETLYAQSLVLDLRESASRPYAGIVTVKTQGLNQHGDVIMTFERSVMVYKRSADNDKGLFPEAKVPITDGVDLG